MKKYPGQRYQVLPCPDANHCSLKDHPARTPEAPIVRYMSERGAVAKAAGRLLSSIERSQMRDGVG